MGAAGISFAAGEQLSRDVQAANAMIASAQRRAKPVLKYGSIVPFTNSFHASVDSNSIGQIEQFLSNSRVLRVLGERRCADWACAPQRPARSAIHGLLPHAGAARTLARLRRRPAKACCQSLLKRGV